MKKIVGLLLIVSLAFTLNAQSPWNGFFKPVTENEIYAKAVFGSAITVDSVRWKFRPSVFVAADAIKINGGVAVTNPLSAIGTGVSYSKYIDNNGTPYQQLSISALLLTNISIGTTAFTRIGGGVVVGAFDGIVNIGAAYIGNNVYVLLGTTLKL